MEEWSVNELLNNIGVYLIIKDELKMLEERRKELRLGILRELKQLKNKVETLEFIAERKINKIKIVNNGAVDFMASRGLERYLEFKLVAEQNGLESAWLNEDITDEEYNNLVHIKEEEHLVITRKE